MPIQPLTPPSHTLSTDPGRKFHLSKSHCHAVGKTVATVQHIPAVSLGTLKLKEKKNHTV